MKKFISFVLSLTVMFSMLAGMNFNAQAEEGSTYLSQDDVMWFTNKFLYTLTESEKAMYGDVLTKINPEIEWSETDWDVVKDCVNKAQGVWSKVSKVLPSSITDNEYVTLGKNSLKYLSSTI